MTKPPQVPPRRITPPFEKHRLELPLELQQAARQILQDFLLAESGPRITANYQPRTNSGPRSRDTMAEAQRDARATIELIRAQYGPELMRDIEFFIACVITRPDGTPMRFEDGGALIVPGRNSESQKWAGYGALIRSLTVLARFYARQRALGKVNNPATPQDREVLKSVLSRLAEQRRLRRG